MQLLSQHSFLLTVSLFACCLAKFIPLTYTISLGIKAIAVVWFNSYNFYKYTLPRSTQREGAGR